MVQGRRLGAPPAENKALGLPPPQVPPHVRGDDGPALTRYLSLAGGTLSATIDVVSGAAPEPTNDVQEATEPPDTLKAPASTPRQDIPVPSETQVKGNFRKTKELGVSVCCRQ